MCLYIEEIDRGDVGVFADEICLYMTCAYNNRVIYVEKKLKYFVA